MGSLLPFRKWHLVAAFVFMAALLASTGYQSVSAAGETYRWEDKETIIGTNGSLGGNGNQFSKTQTLSYPGLQAIEAYALLDPIRTPDNCTITLGIQPNASDKSRGTLRRVVDAIPGASSRCPENYNISRHFTTNIQLADANKAGAEPSTNVTVTVYSLVPDGEKFPAESDTLTVKDGNRTIGSRKVTQKYTESGYSGFKHEFRLKTTPGQKSYEACSQALDKCNTAEILTTPLDLYVIRIVQEGGGAPDEVCSAGALGWIICPAINFISDTNDLVYEVVQRMLVVDPITVKPGGALYETWTRFRDIANAAFIIAFLIVVFSQATSIGISSYGIKKLLPRIIAAAILVNVSFFLCQIALDISNIIGVSIANMFAQLQSGDKVNVDLLDWSTLITAVIGGGALAGGAAVVFGAGVTGAMAMILPFLVTALFAVITAIAILIARQVIIILLVALAPLAFVAWILPNTQKYFQLWQNTFTTMLVMFPLVALLFAGSKLAANIVLTTANTPEGIDLFSAIAALSMMFIPLFGIPFIVKFSGGIIGRVAGIVNSPNKGPFDALRKRAEGYRDFRMNRDRTKALSTEGRTKNPFTKVARSNANRAYKYNLAKGIAEETEQEYIAKSALDSGTGGYKRDKFGRAVRDADGNVIPIAKGEQFATRMAGSDNPSHIAAVQASAQATADKLERQSIANREILYKARLEPGNLDQIDAEVREAAKRNDTVAVRALQNLFISNGSSGIDKMRTSMQAVEDMQTNGLVAAKTLADARKNLQENHGQKMKEKSYDMLLWSTQAGDGGKLAAYSGDANTWKGLSVAEIAAQSGGSVQHAAASKAITKEKYEALLDDKRVSERLSDKQVAALKQGRAYQSYEDAGNIQP